MKRLLVLAETYPSHNNIYALGYVHSRLVRYRRHFDVTVLSFNATEEYEFEGIRVITENQVLGEMKAGCKFDVLISHAPNVRNHLRFISKQRHRFAKLALFFHGHEILSAQKYYPKPFHYDTAGKFRRLLQAVYDPIKLSLISKALVRYCSSDLTLVFVSEWMQEAGLNSLQTNSSQKNDLIARAHVIHNTVNQAFVENSYTPTKKPNADFITIRPFDNSKYAIDIVVDIAKNNPHQTFHVYGKGKYFAHNPPPKNLTLFNRYISQHEIPAVLDSYSAALMPTRLDAQGVMMCELAVYGIPVVTSDLPICQEMLAGFSNVAYINNDNGSDTLDDVIQSLCRKERTLPERFFPENTVDKEIELFL